MTVEFRTSRALYEQARTAFAAVGFTAEDALACFMLETVVRGRIPFPFIAEDVRQAQAITQEAGE